MMDYGPICPMCTADWDTRFDYCRRCDTAEDEMPTKKAKKQKKAAKARHLTVVPAPTGAPIYEQLVLDFGFAPHVAADRRNIPAGPGLLEDNFS